MGLWVNDFKRGKISIEDAPRPGTLKSAVTAENIDKVHDIVLSDRCVKMRELADAVGISTDKTVRTIGAAFAHATRRKKSDYNSKNTGHAFVAGFVLAILMKNSYILSRDPFMLKKY